MKDKIMGFVKSNGNSATFAELLNKVPGFAGYFGIKFDEYNILLWTGMSEEAASSVNELIGENKLYIHPSNLLSYMYYGHVPDLPIAEHPKRYDTMHWFPAILRTDPI